MKVLTAKFPMLIGYTNNLLNSESSLYAKFPYMCMARIDNTHIIRNNSMLELRFKYKLLLFTLVN